MKRAEINIRDPFVLAHQGKYYLYGTRGATCWGPADGFDVYVSDDLENWSEPHVCFHNDGSFWADRNCWAPGGLCPSGRVLYVRQLQASQRVPGNGHPPGRKPPGALPASLGGLRYPQRLGMPGRYALHQPGRKALHGLLPRVGSGGRRRGVRHCPD